MPPPPRANLLPSAPGLMVTPKTQPVVYRSGRYRRPEAGPNKRRGAIPLQGLILPAFPDLLSWGVLGTAPAL